MTKVTRVPVLEKTEHGLVYIKQEVYDDYADNFQSLSCRIYVRVGSCSDPKDKKGLAHLVEHILLAGVLNSEGKYLYQTFDDEESGEIENNLGGYTANTYTCYHFCTDKENQDKMINNVLLNFCWLIENFSLDNKKLEKEKKRILHEKALRSADFLSYFDDFHVSQIYNMPKFSLGDEESLASITIDDITDFIKKYYIPKNIIVSIAGQPKSIHKIKNFDIYNSQSPIIENFEVAPLQNDLIIAQKYHLPFDGQALYLPVYGYQHKNYAYVRILEYISIFKKIKNKEKMFVFYDIPEVMHSTESNISWFIFFGSHYKGSPFDISEILEECLSLFIDGLEISDFLLLKSYAYKGATEYPSSSEEISAFLGKHYLYTGALADYDDIKQEIDSVDFDKFKIWVKDLFSKPKIYYKFYA